MDRHWLEFPFCTHTDLYAVPVPTDMAIKKKLGESPQKMSPITHCHISVGCQKTKEKFWGKKKKKSPERGRNHGLTKQTCVVLPVAMWCCLCTQQSTTWQSLKISNKWAQTQWQVFNDVNKKKSLRNFSGVLLALFGVHAMPKSRA